MVDVLVSGAVLKMGQHSVPAPATIEAALQAAGGLARLPKMWPAGPIAVRRPLGDRKVKVWRFHLNDPEPQEWRRFELISGDLVVFAWHVEPL
jgi:hypothetical protein